MATIAQTMSLNAHGGITRVVEGNKTQVIYTLLRDQKYTEAIKLLNNELQSNPKSRAALSLLAYCYYYMQDFPAAAQQ